MHHHSTRRCFLQAGSLVSLGLGLSEVLRLRATGAERTGANHDTAVILVWLTGGLSHLDTYDMKPTAPAEYRGDFRPISTQTPGIEVCEHLPRHALVADRFTLIRSMSHQSAGHDGAHRRVMTGRTPKPRDGFVNDFPAVGAIVARHREGLRPEALPFTSGQRAGTGVDSYAQGAAYLGQAYAPFLVAGDPSQPKWSIPNLAVLPRFRKRLDQRQSLLGELDRLRAGIDPGGHMESSDRFQRQAFSLLTSDVVRKAFDLSREDPALRDRYGRNPYGQQALLARRLIEAGTSFATVVMDHPGGKTPRNSVANWDCHAVNCHVFDDARWRLPHFDAAVASLIEDLYARGLDRKVLLIVTGEFGHTPRVTYAKGTGTGVTQPGRDHWPAAMSMLISGGGLRMGQVIGRTNSLGEHPQDRPLSPNDLWATAYRHLGVNPQQTYPDYAGRPQPILVEGEAIRELI